MTDKDAKVNFLGGNSNDPYKHAPPKPDGDPWAILLKPELEADKMRCDSWKEEVQTLLIFAGLFSAVVTAFVIESYKFLKPDPNDAIIGLLFHIANSLNNSSSLAPIDPASIVTSFVQTPSSIRINVFWFLSLILSLTTVLAGTIALQWLREHQSYTGYSAKETLAILNMRSEAIETWHVPWIFAGLPLLLQAALVLFLAGLVDFSLPLGSTLTISVSVIVGLTLLFLAATTALPTFQALAFLTGLYSRNKLPSPCAFRSPQSYAFHSLFRILLRAFSFIFPRYSIFPEDPYSNKPTYRDQPADRQYLVPHLYIIWDQETYDFDYEWLSLRDACHQFILDNDPCLFEHRQSWEDEFPLSDVTCCVVDVVKEVPSPKHTELFLSAAYYCFQEISSSIWNKCEFSKHTRIDRRNHYFQELQENSNFNSTATFLYHGGAYKWERFSNVEEFELERYMMYSFQHSSLFHEDQMLRFLLMLLETHESSAPVFGRYQLELWSRTMKYLMTSYIEPLTPNRYSLSFLPVHIIPWRYSLNMLDTGHDYSDIASLLNTIFRSVACNYITEDQLTNPKHYIGKQIVYIIHPLAITIAESFKSIKGTNISDQKDAKVVSKQYSSIFEFVANYLDNEISKSSSEDTACPLFYLSSFFTQQLLLWGPFYSKEEECTPFGKEFSDMFDALRRYKTWTFGRKNGPIEAQFMGNDQFSNRNLESIGRFSDEWWDALFDVSGNSGDVIVQEQGLPSTEADDSNCHLEPFLAVPSPSPLECATGFSTVESATVRPDTADQILTSELSNKAIPRGIPVIGPSDDMQTGGDSVIDIVEPTALEEHIVDPKIIAEQCRYPQDDPITTEVVASVR